MRREVELYIGGKRADIDNDALILYNYTAEQLDNPTIIKNSYSQQITLQGTENNNKLFGAFFRVDRQTADGGGVGASFDATKKTSFQIFDSIGQQLESGYVKLDEIVKRGVDVEYKISLFGGLGDFFYSLSNDAEGAALTLADLDYEVALSTTIDLSAAVVSDAWTKLINGQGTWQKVINFAPCYNGIPKDFEAKKVAVGLAQYQNVPSSNGEYFPYNGEDGTLGAIIVTMENDHDEWEMRDLRAYLQRPVISVKAVIEAIARTTGYNFVIEQGWQSDTRYTDLWLTLPIYRAESYTGVALSSLLEGTITPAAFLISYARTFGLVFVVEGDTIKLMKRTTFYGEEQQSVIDLTGRIDKTSITERPFAFDSKWYAFKNEVKGAFADYYLEKYGKTYGEQRLDTGYDFDSNIKELTSGIKFKGAVQALESSPLFRVINSNAWQLFAPAYSENCTYRLYNGEGSSSDFNVEATGGSLTITDYNSAIPFADVTSKPQFHDAEGKEQDGAGVLLFFNGQQTLPVPPSTDTQMVWQLSDDLPAVFKPLTDGKPCWRASGGVALSSVPLFSRWNNVYSLDWGTPSELAVQDAIPSFTSVFSAEWSKYLSDRYDNDSRVMTAKVDLRGLQVKQSLLRRFFHYEGAIWALNKVINHSITTDDLSQCEFVKVQDRANYTTGGIAYYFDAYPDAITLENERLTTITINTNDSWEVTTKPSWLYVSPPSGTGNAVITIEADATSADRSASLVFSTGNSGSHTVTIRQLLPLERALSVEPTTLSWNDGDTSAKEVVVTALNCEWEVASASDWLNVEVVSGGLLISNRQTSTGYQSGGVTIRSINTTPILQAGVICTKQAAIAYYTRFDESYLPIATLANTLATAVIGIESNDSWALSTDAEWLSFSQSSGQDDAEVIITATSNGGTERSATITLSSNHSESQTITLTQEAAGYFLRVTPATLSVPKGGNAEIYVESNESWTAATSSSVVLDVSSGTGNGTIPFMIKASTGVGVTRFITITTASGLTSRVTIYVIAATTYYLNVTPLTAEIQRGGGSVNISIQSNDSWSITLPSWISTNSPLSGGSVGTTTNTTITFNVSENATGSDRTGDITITGANSSAQIVAITQNGIEYYFTATPSSISVGAAQEDFTINVSSNDSWSITYPSWVVLADGVASGTGNGVVRLRAQNNAGGVRTGTIACVSNNAGVQNIAITQASGAYCRFAQSTMVLEVGVAEQVNVQCNDSVAWTITNPHTSLEVYPLTGTGNAAVSITLTEEISQAITISIKTPNTELSTLTIYPSGVDYLVVTPMEQTIKKGTQSTITVESNGSWTVSSPISTMTVSPKSGTGNGVVDVVVKSTASTSRRNLTVTSASGTVVKPIINIS